MTAISAGRSPSTIHTQSGPRTISSSVISATSAAGIKRAPTVRNASPSPTCPTPSSTRNVRSCADTVPGWVNGATATTTRNCERQIAGAIDTSRRCRVMTMVTAKASVIKSETPTPSAPPLPGPPTINATPNRATPMATSARPVIDPASAIQASRAANMGAAACMKRTFATVA